MTQKPRGLALLLHHIDLVFYKTYADLRAETERTYLGFVWWVIDPIIHMAVLYLVFGVLLGLRTDDFVAFLFVGVTIWQWFANCINQGSQTILANRGLMRQVLLPKALFPLVLVLSNTVKFLFVFGLLLAFLWITGYRPTVHYAALPMLLGVQLLFIIAGTLLLSAIVPFIPDLRFVISNVLQAAFFLSGVMVDITALPSAAPYLGWYYLNPMVNFIESYRRVLLHNQWPDSGVVLWLLGLSLVGILGGMLLIRRYAFVYPKMGQ